MNIFGWTLKRTNEVNDLQRSYDTVVDLLERSYDWYSDINQLADLKKPSGLIRINRIICCSAESFGSFKNVVDYENEQAIYFENCVFGDKVIREGYVTIPAGEVFHFTSHGVFLEEID